MSLATVTRSHHPSTKSNTLNTFSRDTLWAAKDKMMRSRKAIEDQRSRRDKAIGYRSQKLANPFSPVSVPGPSYSNQKHRAMEQLPSAILQSKTESLPSTWAFGGAPPPSPPPKVPSPTAMADSSRGQQQQAAQTGHSRRSMIKERTNKICLPYTISEDMSGDRRNRILSRISEKKRDSGEVSLRIRSSYKDGKPSISPAAPAVSAPAIAYSSSEINSNEHDRKRMHSEYRLAEMKGGVVVGSKGNIQFGSITSSPAASISRISSSWHIGRKRRHEEDEQLGGRKAPRITATRPGSTADISRQNSFISLDERQIGGSQPAVRLDHMAQESIGQRQNAASQASVRPDQPSGRNTNTEFLMGLMRSAQTPFVAPDSQDNVAAAEDSHLRDVENSFSHKVTHQRGAAQSDPPQPGHQQQPQVRTLASPTVFGKYPYGHPYYSSPYYNAYMNQYQPYDAGAYTGGPYGAKG